MKEIGSTETFLKPRVLERKQGERARLPDDIGWKIVAEEMGLKISHRKLKKHMGKWQCSFRAKAWRKNRGAIYELGKFLYVHARASLVRLLTIFRKPR